ncbi:hypothetical protein HDU82_004517 [Entophlyctis luteolus]|nr:hypothetical protein HDU82_004517 [Entophlyctis luteolus]
MLLRPSEYICERSLSIEERLLRASTHPSPQLPRIVELITNSDALSKVSDVPMDRPLFEPMPSELILQSYEPFRNYEIFPRKIKLDPINHPNFLITGIKNASLQSAKVAPGIEVQFLLKFSPEDKIDYSYNLVCITEREKFLLPIRAIGARGLLDVPDEISFSLCPVRFTTTKTLFVRNIGNIAAKFVIDVDPPFEAVPNCGFLDVNKNLQIDVNFKPECGGKFNQELLIKYDTGEIISVRLSAIAEDADIQLEKNCVKLDSTYITLSSMKSIRIFNNSDKIVIFSSNKGTKFRWKMFGTIAEDRQHKLKKKLAADKLEEADCLAFYSHLTTNQSLALCDLSPLTQKYKNKRREIENDPLLCTNPEFCIQPVEGTVWPNSYADVFIVFNPTKAGPNSTSVFCEVVGRQHRLPLLLKGEGIGPKGRFSYDSVDIREVFINTRHKYEIFFENRGEIDFNYWLERPNTAFAGKFGIVPERGRLKVGEQQLVEVTFNSDLLGSFAEVMEWELEGAPERLSICFRGDVIGPTFDFSLRQLDFGRLSYGFPVKQCFAISNTSLIPMTYNLHMGPECVPKPKNRENNEFEIVPRQGTIPPKQATTITVNFTPMTLKTFDERMCVDVEKVGENLRQLPVLADIVVPEITLVTPVLDYSDCFLSFTYQKDIELRNDTDFSARFMLLSQEETAKSVFTFASLNGSGIIPPHSVVNITLDIQVKRLGFINFPIFIKVTGNEVPLIVDIVANGIGPNVLFSSMELNWGKIPVLKDAMSALKLTNNSPIPAIFACSTISESSCFKIEPGFGTIPPGDSADIVATAYLDDSLKFTDILKVSVQSDGVYEVQLVARGIGSTITFDESLRHIEFNDVFSNRECSREFVLTNRGRRAQTLHWIGDEDKVSKKDNMLNIGPTFEVIPSRFLLKPGAFQTIVVKGYSSKACHCKETLLCQAVLDKDRKVIIEASVSANFINPLLDISPSNLKFISAQTNEENMELLSQCLLLKNISMLPLHLSFRCPEPYSIEPEEPNRRLNSGESFTLTVNYDPAYNTNRISCKEHSKILITYSEHPQRDFIELYSEITFPNIKFSTSDITFGCIPNNTEQRKAFTISNCSTMRVEYNWYFLEDSIKYRSKSDLKISQVFDILPTRSILEAGESETAEVAFYGHPNNTFSCTAICDVTGGPKYELVLNGEASTIDFAFDKQSLDFGTRMYQDIVDQDITISNTGNVTFDYTTIIAEGSSLWHKIMVNPCSGTIPPRGKQKINIRFCACLPETVDDCFFVQIALFEPIRIRVTGSGIFPLLKLGIPRVADAKYETAIAEAKVSLAKPKKALMGEKKNPSPIVAQTIWQAESAKIDDGLDFEAEVEADRCLLKDKTSQFLSELNEELKQKCQVVAKNKHIGSIILFSKSLQKSKDKKTSNSIFEASEVVLAKYLCNFGNVIKNTMKKKSFKLTNRSSHAISFQLDKSAMLGTGFSIEPDRVKLLPGKPHYESVEFQVTFHARTQSIGVVQLDLPILVQGGPTTILTLQAEITLPDLQLSTNDVDFGEVTCGMRKTVMIQLHNKNSVPCEWSTQQDIVAQKGEPAEKGAKKRNAGILKEFDFVPKFGILQPGEKMMVAVRFSASEDKEYEAFVPFKINMNNQPIPIHLRGKGTKPIICFEPESLVLGPILPCSDGVEGKFSIYNPTNSPIEVYSLEFDQLYEEEEELIRNLDGFEANVLYLPPREPGQPLPEALVEQAKLNMQRKANPILLYHESNAGLGQNENMESFSSSSQRSPGIAEQQHDLPFTIILHGPPYSGKTTQAKKLQTLLDFAYVNIDDVIEECGRIAIEPVEMSKVTDSLTRVEERSSTVSRTGPVFAEDARKAADFDHPEEIKSVSDDYIAEILRSRLQRPDCAKGIVIDGLESKFVPNALNLAKIIIRVLGEKRKAAFINLAVDNAQIKERELAAQKAAGEIDYDPTHVKDVTEEEYDNMTEQERAHYDICLMKYKKKMKELQDKRKTERRLLEEEIAMRLGERKAEEEHVKGGKKKGGKRATPKIPDKPKLDQKNVKPEKGTVSPKTAKKALIEKDLKDIKAPEKFLAADEDSTLNPPEPLDTFASEMTLKRLESYNQTYESILSLLKEMEKSVGRVALTSPIVEKKPTGKEKEKEKDKEKAKILPIAPPSDIALLTGLQDGESPISESSSIAIHDVVDHGDSESVHKTIAEWIPPVQSTEELQSAPDVIPPPYLEQIYVFPAEREHQIKPKNFQLFPPTVENEDENGNADGSSKADAISAPILSLGTQAATAPQLAVAPQPLSVSKKGRLASKVAAEEIKPVDEVVVEEEIPTKFRWIIPPKERKELTCKFNSSEIGKFDQSLQFEIAGSKIKYSISCVGYCKYAMMSNDTKKIFPKWRKAKEEKYISHGEFIASTATLEFGPLLFSKPREKYLEKFPENRVTLTLSNPSTQEIKIAICLKNDVKSDIFFLEPSSIDLGAGQSQIVNVWAYPRSANYFEDTLICCVKDNPEPYCFKVSCIGVRPELEIDKRQLSFDKLLLGRSERREIKLKNNTLMPVAWKLVQVELLGEEFTVSPVDGILEPFLEQTISADFKGTKPVVISRRSIRLEVSDTEKIGGVVQEVPIMITAEAYDIAMDLHFPKGYEGGLDFGVIKVLEEGKQICTLKNKGKYEVGFKFICDSKDLMEIFTIVPAQGIMQPSDKPFPVQVIVKANREMNIRDNSNLKCQFYEPATGEVTSTIPVKLQVRSVFSRFSILPVRELNFGALVHGTKASRQFTIENQGEFDFKYSIYKIVQGLNENRNDKKLRTQSRTSKGPRPLSPPPPAKIPNKKEVVKQTDATNFGMFTVFPTTSIVPAGAKHQITVEFHSETPGSFEEIVAIDISDRSPNDYFDVIEYRLIAEDCVPGINTSEFASIFEEHTICKRLELFNNQSNVYAEEDRVFYFGAFLAGHQAQVRFKISNPYKVPCDISVITKPRSKTKSDAADFAFEVDPKRLTIPSHEYRYITAFFHPTSIQSYAGLFEATVENVDQSKTKSLIFELRGEGTLPRVTVEKPLLKNKNGQPLLKFRRLFVGAAQTLPIVLRNEGITVAKVKLEWVVKEQEEFECAGVACIHVLRPQESCTIDVRCRALAVRKFENDLKIRVIDNSFEDSIVQLSGEGYVDDLVFDDMPSELENEVELGDCFIGEQKHVSFTLSNYASDIMRISWLLDTSDFVFSPMVAHLQPKSKKEITVTFCEKQPNEANHIKALCKPIKIRYLGQSPDIDWDDKSKSVRWIPSDGNNLPPRKLVEQSPEPLYEQVGPPLAEKTLLLSANADYSTFECDVNSIKFKSTLMFQTRVYKFILKNPGKILLKYQLLIFSDSHSAEYSADDCPFSVTPSSGSIEAGESESIAVKFSPLEDGVFNFKLVGKMQNLPKDTKPISIKLIGASLRPFCHFELEESDYLTGDRRNPDIGNSEVPLNLPQQTKVIEFGSCGVKVRNTKRFYIVNPTNFSYEFEWSTSSTLDQKIFRCVTPRGTVASNKKFEIVFPEVIDVKESFWTFSILDHNISIPFLLVGHALEPNLFFDRVSVNFKSLLVGRQLKEVVNLVNNEMIPFAFSFSETSFELGIDQNPVLKFAPTSGTIGAHSEMPIEITFCPSAEKTFNFNLLCNIKKKPTPVSINVKGEGYEIHELLQSEMADGAVFDLAHGINSENVIDFGQAQINEKRLKRVIITNSGKLNFDFSWKFLSKVTNVLKIDPEIGTVPKGERVICEISFLPTTNVVLKNVKAVCQIVNGKIYPLTVQGSGSKPLLKFSVMSFDFGTHFVYRPGVAAPSTKVRITNQDTKEISIEIPSREMPVFDVKKGAGTLNPGESTDLDITFYPKEAKAYNDIIKIEMNGLSVVNFPVSGIGSEFRVEPVSADSKSINFGAIRVGHVVTKTIKLINKSIIPAKFSLGPPGTLDVLGMHFVTVSPIDEINLRPKGVATVEFKFAPQTRVPPFEEEINIEAPGISRLLMNISGACQGIEVRLENDTLPFGAVVQKSCTTRRIQIQNTGDIGTKFHWDASKFAPDFSISSPEGYISPGMEIPIDITFHPVDINQDIRYESLVCSVEGAPPLFLTLTGMCIPQPIQNDIIKFSTPVRQSDVKGIKIENKTSTLWHIRPIIENENWSGAENIDIEPGQSKVYDVVFTPMETMGAGDGGRHEGSIFFPLPDGSGLLYKLNGVADKPISVGTITREIPCKTQFIEVLAVSNWLKKPQRFRVITEFAKSDPSTILKGLEFIDVPGLVTREYKMTYYAYKEGVMNAKVIFKNEQTQEFLFYNLMIKSTPPGTIATIDMVTAVRQICCRDIIISNPLSTPVTFNTSCNHSDISTPHSFVVQAKSDGVCTVEFLPLQPKEAVARLAINSSELGMYQYDLKLAASAVGSERSLHFKVGLGGTQTQTFRFLSFAKNKTEYSCRVDSIDFSVEKSVSAPSATNGGVEVCVDVMYEPSKLGDQRTQLVVSSPVGGDYICQLYGHCTAPRPQGPITIKVGSSASVAFKNVFTSQASFGFVVDNPAFTVKAQETILPKKVITMTITALPSPPNDKAAKIAKVGKLTVTHKGSSTSWVYYLRTQI